MNHSQQVPSRDQLLAKAGVLLIVDQITPPSGPVAKGVTPVVKERELALFIAVSDDGLVYAFNGHVDLGTGIRTSLAQIVAEELDLRMDQVHMVLGDTERAPNQGATIASATLQISAVPLRKAAATARRFLLQQAAKRLACTPAALRIEEGAVVAGNGSKLSFAELVQGENHQLYIADDAPLKAIEDYRLVGRSAARVDIPGKATGELTYVHDMRLPNMLHGRVIRPPYAGHDSGDFVGNSLLAVDEASIAHVPGVVAVVVIRDFVGVVAEREEQAIRAAQELEGQLEAFYRQAARPQRCRPGHP
ncbi:Nicotinate dehydrogenase subunit B [Pseudomonas sp. MM223]|nr:Nicotinate dehydrogenase subunit B [Pseudomonas sp. MM223]